MFSSFYAVWKPENNLHLENIFQNMGKINTVLQKMSYKLFFPKTFSISSSRQGKSAKAHKKYEPFLNKSIDHYDEMALVVGKDMATGSFARTFADIDLDDGNQDSVPLDCYNEEDEEVRTNVSSSGTSKRKRKNVQESVVDEQVKFMGEQLGKIANALEQFIADKTPQLYEQVMSMEEEGFHDGFLCSVFDYLPVYS
ncbi:uncharacterized protein [Gossypium hirsutum]|uniref:Uncharacterized protein n=1 Tax=Gossypium hirsutum TaxID=3635 RepID=A0A1U8PER1_GOSHI|nr:uncharacterized protein LOC107958431 [Gossypium hirsutum]